jgi:NADPH-dependent curcumin reductase CurA
MKSEKELKRIPEAFIGLFEGRNMGKLLVEMEIRYARTI